MPDLPTDATRPMVDKGAVVRVVVYSIVILYLVVDLFLVGGPLRKSFARKSPSSPDVIEAAKDAGVVARIHYQPILLTQVDRRVEENLWRAGRSGEGLPREERILLRRAALNELIDLHLLRLKVRFSQSEVPVGDEEIEDELARFTRRFATESAYLASLQELGWSEKELRFRIAARIQQENYLAKMIAVEVSEEEAREWFEANSERLAYPERVRARHIFRSTVGLDKDAARAEGARLREVVGELAGGADFGALARAQSEDSRSKGEGGDLGWLQRERVPEDLREGLFAARPKEPFLLQSRIGWHVIEVLEKKPGRERSFEEARTEVLAALETVKRRDGLRDYRKQLRERDRKYIEIFFDVLERGLE